MDRVKPAATFTELDLEAVKLAMERLADRENELLEEAARVREQSTALAVRRNEIQAALTNGSQPPRERKPRKPRASDDDTASRVATLLRSESRSEDYISEKLGVPLRHLRRVLAVTVRPSDQKLMFEKSTEGFYRVRALPAVVDPAGEATES